MGDHRDTTPQPLPQHRRGSRIAPSSSEEGDGGGVQRLDRQRHRLYERAAKGRGNQTEPEKRLWNALRNRSLEGFKFRRQAVIGNRIVDFFCPAKGLVVEVDGITHDPEADALADSLMLRDHGFQTVRFTNDEVMKNLDGVLQSLADRLRQASARWPGHCDTTPRPPPLKRRGRDSRDVIAPSSSEEGVGGGVGVSVAEAIRDAAARLGTDWARDEAEMLMAHTLGVSRSAMLLGRMRDPAPADFAAMIERRLAHEPVAHIMGETEFYGRCFEVTPDTLIPRGDSETVIRAALEAKPDARRILDLGTGSGCLLLTLLAELPVASGTGSERSSEALAVARRNATALGVAARADLRQGDWTVASWADGLGRYDLVVANPPYIEDRAELDASVRDFEPAGALFAGPDGLDDYRLIIPQLAVLLTPDGVAVLEIGYDQADAVAALADASGFASALHRDLAGRPRALVLWEKGLANVR